jgi:hypothetical protein
MALWQDSTGVRNRQVPEARIRKFRVQPLDCYFEEQAKRELLNSKHHIYYFILYQQTQGLVPRPLYALHLGGRCDQVIDSIEVSAVEEADFNLAAAAFGSLKYSDLSA